MEIKVHKPQQNQHKQENEQQQKPLRMTLKEYLESTNLKRRINSRSKSKSRKQSTGQQSDQKHLEPPNYNQTAEYFKLNQQWKAKKVFNSWINNLKQLCRQYIKADSEFVQIIRLIQKIVDFVKNQIQTIKKDNLLLQSYLVTEASYWPQGSTYNQQPNNDKLSNYLKTLLGKNDSCESPNKSQQIHQNSSPQQKPQSQNQLQNMAYKTSTQPKIRSNHQQISTKYCPKQQNHYTSSTGVKTSQDKSFPTTQTLQKRLGPNLQKEQYIYSFKDKPLDVKHGNSLQRRKRSQQNVQVNPFSYYKNADQIDEEEENLEISKYNDPGLLKIHSRNEEQVPRLSLMSRYDLNKNNLNSTQDLNEVSKINIQDVQPSRMAPTHLSQMSTKSQISQQGQGYQNRQVENKVPLRDRKQKVQKYSSQCPDEFQMIVLDPKKEFGQKDNNKQILKEEVCRNTKRSDISHQKTHEKVHVQKEQQRNGQQHNYTASPFTSRQSPHIISLETPSTLRRCNQHTSEATSTKKYEEIRVNITNPLNPSNQLNDRSVRPTSAVYKSSVISYESSTRNSSRQNIMRRYENFGK